MRGKVISPPSMEETEASVRGREHDLEDTEADGFSSAANPVTLAAQLCSPACPVGPLVLTGAGVSRVPMKQIA